MSAAVGDDEPGLINSRNVRAADTEREAGQNEAEASNSNGPDGTEDEDKPRESKLKKIWAKLDLDLGTVMMMFK